MERSAVNADIMASYFQAYKLNNLWYNLSIVQFLFQIGSLALPNLCSLEHLLYNLPPSLHADILNLVDIMEPHTVVIALILSIVVYICVFR